MKAMQKWRGVGIVAAVAAVFIMLCVGMAPAGNQALLLWHDGAPGAAGDRPEDKPRLTVYLPPKGKANGTAVIIYPGGAYVLNMSSYVGSAPARWLNGLGVTAFVLEYRLAPRYRHPAPIEDAQRAIRYVRYHRAEYGLAENRIGVLGFSAGGHLAALAATGFSHIARHATDAVDGASARPDFVMLGYPLISMLLPYAHEPSVKNLLGPSPSEDQRRLLSAELHVTPDTPPVFMFQADGDRLLSPQNSVLFYEALHRAKVPVELHIFAHGGHGFGMADGSNGTPGNPAIAIWARLAQNWMESLGLLGISPASLTR
jgi:acetyl esterase/lipase